MSFFGIYDVTTKAIRCLWPFATGKVGIYVCGVTVHNSCHVGHIKMMIAFDTIGRWLRELGYTVFLVQNITDFAGEVLQQTNDKLAVWLQTETMVLRLKNETAAFNLVQPNSEPRAAWHVLHTQKLVKLLVKRKAAQLTDGDVCFLARRESPTLDETNQQPPFGRSDEQEGNARLSGFAIWRATAQSNSRLGWLSPYGIGKPGWHIECSAMCNCSFGGAVDVHGGGKDLRFPHHSNERSQNDILMGKGYVRHWVHSGLISVGSTKMSNSTNNPIRICPLLKEFRSETLRFYVLCCHYSSQLEFDVEHLRRAQKILVKVCTALPSLVRRHHPKLIVDWNELNARSVKDFMNQDVNTPPVISNLLCAIGFAVRVGCFALLRQCCKLANAISSIEPQIVVGDLNQAEGWLLTALGIDCSILIRCTARARLHYPLADNLRLKLNSRSIIINDNGDITSWSWVGHDGGLDSTALLLSVLVLQHLLRSPNRQSCHNRVNTVHTRHSLGLVTQNFVRCSCSAGVRCQTIATIGVAKLSQTDVSFELTSRILRYKLFSTTSASDVLWLGHHFNDLAETLKVQSSRGTGLNGLAGMTELSLVSSRKPKLRPFLQDKRRVLQGSVVLRGLSWLSDVTNKRTNSPRTQLRIYQDVAELKRRANGLVRTAECFRLISMVLAHHMGTMTRRTSGVAIALLEQAVRPGKLTMVHAFSLLFKRSLGYNLAAAQLTEIINQFAVPRKAEDTIRVLLIRSDKALAEVTREVGGEKAATKQIRRNFGRFGW